MSDNGRSTTVDAQQILRSINVTLDNATPERIAHFSPTAKSARLLRSWLMPGHASSYFVVAPYGTGKSLTAAFFIQAVENLEQSRDVLRRITERFSSVDADLADVLRARVHSDQASLFAQQGATVVLSGFQPDVPAAVQAALLASLKRIGNQQAARIVSRRQVTSMEEVIAVLSKIRERFCPNPIDRLAIVWDEFGRHLEELVVRGTSASLADVQTLAEFCARTKRVPTTFALLLHQGLSRYATNTSVTVQREWKKIEGRFETIQFVDDSKELYQLIGQIMRQIRSDGPPPRKVLDRGLGACRDVGLFGDFSPEETEQMLSDSYPLEPITLYLLPRVSSRVAQNERTLFTFLYSLVTTDFTSGPVTPDSLYDYFSDAMRSDSLPGGSYHTWLETESALHKANPALDQKALKCACLLGLGLVGERSRVSRKLLERAVSGYGAATAARDSVRRLIGSNLLLYRRNADNVSIWHGTDLDLRGRLDQEKDRLGPRFDHVAFLTSEAPPAPWKSVDYNVEYGTERYFESRYVAAHTILMADDVKEVLPSAATADGMLYVVVPESHEELGEVRKHLERHTLEPTVVVALPRQSDQLAEAALDVYALQLLRQDTSLLAEDPLVEPELAQMIDDAQGHLTLHLNRMFHPSAEGPEYRWRDLYHELLSPKQLRQFLSSIMREVYPLTPRIKNEIIVRRRPRPAIVNSRKKLILGILERSGTENLGLEGYRPDMSMFRTVLLLTGLYRCDLKAPDGEATAWRYVDPEELQDEGLRQIWELVRDFLTTPSGQPKPLSDLISMIGSAPYGVRSGIVPILLAAGIRAFPGPISITTLDGSYVSDLLPSTIEEMAAHPREYQVLVPKLATGQRDFLDRVATLFGYTDATGSEADPVRRCHDALVTWRSSLPYGALSSRYLSASARSFGRLMTAAIDPYRLLFDAVPMVLNVSSADVSGLLHALFDCKAEIEGVLDWNYEAASRTIRSAFPAVNGDDASLRETVAAWAEFFPATVAQEIKDSIAQALISRARMCYSSDEALADALAALLVGKRISRWEDSSIVVFERELGAVIRRVEDRVLSLSVDVDGVQSQSIVDIATSRLRISLHAIARTVGADEARTITNRTLEQLSKEERVNGSHTRST
ncbi:MAG: hypothetical protein OXC12_04960 [Spirochaetaceae bacterium]|nr:hypothetical protein [Spirochaetaceae bacterium]